MWQEVIEWFQNITGSSSKLVREWMARSEEVVEVDVEAAEPTPTTFSLKL
jgi:hypothetical protein